MNIFYGETNGRKWKKNKNTQINFFIETTSTTIVSIVIKCPRNKIENPKNLTNEIEVLRKIVGRIKIYRIRNKQNIRESNYIQPTINEKKKK